MYSTISVWGLENVNVAAVALVNAGGAQASEKRSDRHVSNPHRDRVREIRGPAQQLPIYNGWAGRTEACSVKENHFTGLGRRGCPRKEGGRPDKVEIGVPGRNVLVGRRVVVQDEESR